MYYVIKAEIISQVERMLDLGIQSVSAKSVLTAAFLKLLTSHDNFCIVDVIDFFPEAKNGWSQ